MDDDGEFEDSHGEEAEMMNHQFGGNNRRHVAEDDEFGEFGMNEFGDPLSRSQLLRNQHADEAVDLSDHSEMDDSVNSAELSMSHHSQSHSQDFSANSNHTNSSTNNAQSMMNSRQQQQQPQQMQSQFNNQQYQQPQQGNRFDNPASNMLPQYNHGNPDDEDAFGDNPSIQQHRNQYGNDADSDEDRELQVPTLSGDPRAVEVNHADGGALYNPDEYRSLNMSVAPEIRDMFEYIGRYKPQSVEIESKLKPFIPDYIPAIGEIDAFIKIPRPDDKTEMLGLTVLDEPATRQSDPTSLDLFLRLHAKQAHLQPVAVRSIEHADKNPKKVSAWIANVQEVHRQKPPPTVNYSKQMPDIEQLMQVWPQEFEEALKELPLPPPDINMSLSEYARLCCTLLDIPVHNGPNALIESLHVMFSLYTEFKDNQHFQQA